MTNFTCPKCHKLVNVVALGYKLKGRPRYNAYLCIDCHKKLKNDLGVNITKDEYLKWLKRRYKRKVKNERI